jgi:hypothetical protein
VEQGDEEKQDAVDLRRGAATVVAPIAPANQQPQGDKEQLLLRFVVPARGFP